MIEKIKNNIIGKSIIENFKTIIMCLLVIQICDFLSIFIFKKSFLFVHFLLFILILFVGLVFKDFESKNKKRAIKIIKISLVLFALSLVNTLFVKGFALQDVTLANKIFKMSYLFDLAILILSIAIFKDNRVKDLFESIEEENTLCKIFNIEEEVKPGDAILGIDVDTNKKVILPCKDRFLHMLILGATGSGKTSQTIIPMIYNDMKNLEAGITVLEPKGDLAEKVYAMAKLENREVLYFNPILPDCPYFNPFYGDESDVVENLATTFKMFSIGSSQYFLDMNENLVRRAVKLLKRLYGNDATLLHLDKLIHNTGDEGRKMVVEFSRLNTQNQSIASENNDIAKWFLDDYYTGCGQSGQKGGTKTFEHTSAVRSQVAKLVSNKYLRRVLNPPPGIGTEINFDKALADGTVTAIATAQGALRDLGRFLGYFLILQLQSAVFRRPGNENTRRNHFLTIDEFQVYANPGFADMLTQGRSYRVASHLATQNRALIGMGSGQQGKDFIELVSTNARNIIIYPGGNAIDATYYSKEFGEIKTITRNKTYAEKRFGGTLSDQRVSTSVKEEYKARFSPTDIKYRKFGEITYCIVKNNSIQPPGVSKIQFIPKDINNKIEKIVDEYNEEQIKKDLNVKELIDESKQLKFDDETGEMIVNKENINIVDPIHLLGNKNFFDENDEEADILNSPVVDKKTVENDGTPTIAIDVSDDDEIFS